MMHRPLVRVSWVKPLRRCAALGRRWADHAARSLLLGLVHMYRLFFKAWLGNRCRYWPSCSAYALQAVQQHGPWVGGALAGGRLLRCHPWCLGGEDPVPDHPQNPAAGLFTRLFDPASSAFTNTPRGADAPRSRKMP
jgi:uncharacterized protein